MVDLIQILFVISSRLAVNMYFAPTSEKEVNFNLVCKIQRRVMPVMLNVKAEGYTMNCVLLCEDSAGNRVQLSSRGINLINFGDVSHCCLGWQLGFECAGVYIVEKRNAFLECGRILCGLKREKETERERYYVSMHWDFCSMLTLSYTLGDRLHGPEQ